jgi:hypothetical protein
MISAVHLIQTFYEIRYIQYISFPLTTVRIDYTRTRAKKFLATVPLLFVPNYMQSPPSPLTHTAQQHEK